MTSRRQFVQWTTTLAIAVATSASAAQDKESGMTAMTRLPSVHAFADTVTRLTTALQAKGFTIFATIDQQKAARSVGLDMPPMVLLIYGNPKGGTPLMLAAPDFALELPLKVLVREDAGKVLVVFTPASALEGRHGLPAGLAARLGGAEAVIAAAIGAGSN